MDSVTSSPDLQIRSELDVIHAIVWWLIGNGYLAKGSIVDLLPKVHLMDTTEVPVREVPSNDLMQLERNVSPEKMSASDLKRAIPLCRSAGLRKLHDLCVDALINETDRSDILTSRSFVHQRNIPEEGYRAMGKLLELGQCAEEEHRFCDAERLYEEALYLEQKSSDSEINEYYIAHILLSLSEPHFEQGRWIDAITKLDKSLAITERISQKATVMYRSTMFKILCIHGFVACENGAVADTRKYFVKYLKVNDADKDSHGAVPVFSWRQACVALEENNVEEAESEINYVLAAARLKGNALILACILLDSARVFPVKGDLASVKELCCESLDIWNTVPKNGTRYATISNTNGVHWKVQ